MARTKQTAKNSTGGTARRETLVPSTRVLRSHTPHSRLASKSPQPNANIEMVEEPTSNASIVGNTLLEAAASEVEVIGEAGSTDDSKGDDVSGYQCMWPFFLP